jgi:hypothetical protein
MSNNYANSSSSSYSSFSPWNVNIPMRRRINYDIYPYGFNNHRIVNQYNI